MKKLLLSSMLINLFCCIAFAQHHLAEENFKSFSPSLSFVVNNNEDTNDANTTDNLCADSSGNCTLRAAIQQANATAGTDDISFALVSPATINLTIGELQITDSVNITGLGARNLTVQRSAVVGTGNFRIFNISGASGTTVNMSGISIANGNVLTGNNGGGILNGISNTLNLTDITVRNNTAQGNGNGGGVYNSNNGTVNILRSTFNNNAAFSGGGIYNNFSAMAISNSTVSDNSVTNFGGGINNNNGTVTTTNVTISNNSAANDTGGFGNGGGAFIRNTIIANNTALTNPDVFNGFTTLGNNLIGIKGANITDFNNGVNGDKVGTSASPINPQLGALQNNGGQTDTRALFLTSPAINAGNNCVVTATCPSNNPPEPLTTDQRGAGFSRLMGNAVDIGAFESLAPTAANVTIGGRVTLAKGRGIARAKIELIDSNGEVRIALTNPFGYYRFNNVSAGETYILNATAKGYFFSPQVYSVTSESENLDFVANK